MDIAKYTSALLKRKIGMIYNISIQEQAVQSAFNDLDYCKKLMVSSIAPPTTYVINNINTGTDTPTDTHTNGRTAASTNAPVDAPTDASTNAHINTPTNAPTDRLNDATTDKLTDATTDTPTDAHTDTPTDAHTDSPTVPPTYPPTNPPTDPYTNTYIHAPRPTHTFIKMLATLNSYTIFTYPAAYHFDVFKNGKDLLENKVCFGYDIVGIDNEIGRDSSGENKFTYALLDWTNSNAAKARLL